MYTHRCLIFVLYKKEAVTLLSTLQGKGYNVTAIHGDRNQYERTAALDTFKKGDTPLLIATGDYTCVIHYSMLCCLIYGV